MRRIFAFVILLVLTLTSVSAQNYDDLWLQVKVANQKDMPRDVITILHAIEQKAEKEKQYGQLLQSLTYELARQEDISSDSVAPMVKKIMTYDAIMSKNDKIASLLCHIYLHRYGLYNDSKKLSAFGMEDQLDGYKDNHNREGKSLVDELLSNKKMARKLSAPNSALAYMPFVSKQDGSKYFDDDIISVIAGAMDDYESLIGYYKSIGKREAACMATSRMIRSCLSDHEEEFMEIDSTGMVTSVEVVDTAAVDTVEFDVDDMEAEVNMQEMELSHFSDAIDSIIAEYSDLPVCAALAVDKFHLMQRGDGSKEVFEWTDTALNRWPDWPEMNQLRNYRAFKSRPGIVIRYDARKCRPSVDDAKLYLTGKNVHSMKVNIVPIVGCPEEKLRVDSIDGVKPYLQRDKTQTIEHQMPQVNEFENFKDSLSLGKLPIGVYMLECQANDTTIRPCYMIYRVSDMKVLCLQQTMSLLRCVVVNCTTGHPVPGAKLYIERNSKLNSYITDAKGEYLIHLDNVDGQESECDALVLDGNYTIWAEANGDVFMPHEEIYLSDLNRHYEGWMDDLDRYEVFTDRKIYRPGQIVHIAVLNYNAGESGYPCIEKGKEIEVSIGNNNLGSNFDIIDTTLVIDEFGIAKLDLPLPEHLICGEYEIKLNGADFEYTNPNRIFKVEEYVRPTFNVTIDRPTMAYKAGDTILVKGHAAMFSGSPVCNARVEYKINRENCLWHPTTLLEGDDIILEDTTMTDANGDFVIRMPMLLRKGVIHDNEELAINEELDFDLFYDITANVKVTDLAGESAEGDITLSVGHRPTVLTCELETEGYQDDDFQINRDNDYKLKVRRRNMSGNEISGNVRLIVDGKDLCVVDANKSFSFPASVTSGKHQLQAICEQDTVKQDFILFSLKEKYPAIKTKMWWYQSSGIFPKQKGKGVDVQFGTCDKNVYAVYSLVSNDKVVESGAMKLDSALVTRHFEYKPEYGDGVCFTVAWIRDGVMHSECASISSPMPDYELQLKWATFRDRLKPGKKEEWRLTVTGKTGKPVNANVMATLYDTSLDVLTNESFDWSVDNPFIHDVNYLPWKCDIIKMHITGSQGLEKTLPVSDVKFSSLSTKHFFGKEEYTELCELEELSQVERDAKVAIIGDNGDVFNGKRVHVNYLNGPRKNEDLGEVVIKFDAPVAPVIKRDTEELHYVVKTKRTMPASVRKNFNETAYFCPSLRTDTKGNTTISFTLPETMTTWRFMAFAHDKNMHYGHLYDTVYVDQKILVQPRMPRFLRADDVCEIPASVSNLSDKTMSVKAILTLLDSETETEVYTCNKDVEIKAGETSAVSFPYDTKGQDGKILIARFSVEGDGYSDGEQHYLPVLSAKEPVIETRTMVLDKPGKTDVDVQKILPVSASNARLSVEYTDSPEWFVIQTLPYITETKDDDAISLASSLYANTAASFIANSNPEIRNVVKSWSKDGDALQSPLTKNNDFCQTILKEMSWTNDPLCETSTKNRLCQLFDKAEVASRTLSITKQLRKLQNSDGSWSWWKGMDGSTEVTLSVIEDLLRLKAMFPANEEESDDELEDAVDVVSEDNTADPDIFDASDEEDSEAGINLVDMASIEKMITKGMLYLDKQMNDLVSDKTKNNDNILDYDALKYLYCLTLKDGEKSDIEKSNIDFLLPLLSSVKDNIAGKAIASMIYSANDMTQKAKDELESIRQYSVFREDIGRYFDTYKADYSWCDYRIPTQSLVIEALKKVEPQDTKTISEMQRWLLASKRTQVWDNPINAIDAIHAFFGPCAKSVDEKDKGVNVMCKLSYGILATIFIDNKPVQPVASTTALGYEKTSQSIDNQTKIVTIYKKSDGESWANVFVQYTQPLKDIDASSTGLHIERIINKVDVDGKAIASADSSATGIALSELKVGDKVRVTLTIAADRDYDFVSVTDRRPACLEPVSQLSGYQDGCYQVMHDTQSQYHYDRMAKGTHVITTDYYVSRAGEFSSGTSLVQCAYAPEFSARTKALTLSVTK